MAKEASVAPKERVNITYQSATADGEDVELPLKILALGDYTGRPDDTPVEERKAINIDKDNFNDVMKEHKLGAAIVVPDRLTGDGELALELQFKSLKDFTPEGIVAQVDALQQLLALRGALGALKGPLGNIPSFRKKLQGLLSDDASRSQLMKELGIS